MLWRPKRLLQRSTSSRAYRENGFDGAAIRPDFPQPLAVNRGGAAAEASLLSSCERDRLVRRRRARGGGCDVARAADDEADGACPAAGARDLPPARRARVRPRAAARRALDAHGRADRG